MTTAENMHVVALELAPPQSDRARNLTNTHSRKLRDIQARLGAFKVSEWPPKAEMKPCRQRLTSAEPTMYQSNCMT
eukprot:6203420-Pleurochrysis_carterae.AAC.2